MSQEIQGKPAPYVLVALKWCDCAVAARHDDDDDGDMSIETAATVSNWLQRGRSVKRIKADQLRAMRGWMDGCPHPHEEPST